MFGELALEREVQLVVRGRAGRENDSIDIVDGVLRPGVQVEERYAVALYARRPTIQAVLEPFAEQAAVEVGHVQGGQRRWKERRPAADELDVGAAIEEHLGDAGGVPGTVVVEHDNPAAHRPPVEQVRPRR